MMTAASSVAILVDTSCDDAAEIRKGFIRENMPCRPKCRYVRQRKTGSNHDHSPGKQGRGDSQSHTIRLVPGRVHGARERSGWGGNHKRRGSVRGSITRHGPAGISGKDGMDARGTCAKAWHHRGLCLLHGERQKSHNLQDGKAPGTSFPYPVQGVSVAGDRQAIAGR